ncbi:hypothetical protein K435DRAFT_604527, partial [Dendrothele bispora CBS 962.96]
QWTPTHRFYAAIPGGFIFDFCHEEPFLPGSYRLVITPYGIEFLMQHAPELIPDISEDSLLDHSKANGFGKFLLIWQMSYFSINVAVRKIQGLSISLLEVSTFAHCLCMIMTCILWSDKPLGVEE